MSVQNLKNNDQITMTPCPGSVYFLGGYKRLH
jgi:hypothetical protein